MNVGVNIWREQWGMLIPRRKFELPLPTAFDAGASCLINNVITGQPMGTVLSNSEFCCPQDHFQSAVVSTVFVRVDVEDLYIFHMPNLSFRSIENNTSRWQ